MQKSKNITVKDNLEDFFTLAEKSFEFWNNKKDDIYQISLDKKSGTFRHKS